jgi:hypothetical protein
MPARNLSVLAINYKISYFISKGPSNRLERNFTRAPQDFRNPH